MSDVVLMDVGDDVAVLTLNRPERLNAWTREMHRTYFDLLEECARRDDVRAIVLTGAGRGFCAGADMEDLQQASSDLEGAAAEARDPRPHTLPLAVPKPVIAAINGPAAGLGFVHAMMCDIRFGARGAKLTTAFARRGLVAEHGLSWILPRLIGPARALDLLLSGRVVLAEEAAELGVVNRLSEPDAVLSDAVAYARELALNSSPASMAAMKRQVYADLERGLDDALERANGLMEESFQRPDFAEGVASFVERREPRFAPLGREPSPAA